MSSKWKTISIVVGLVLFVSVSVFAYDSLSKRVQPQNDIGILDTTDIDLLMEIEDETFDIDMSNYDIDNYSTGEEDTIIEGESEKISENINNQNQPQPNTPQANTEGQNVPAEKSTTAPVSPQTSTPTNAPAQNNAANNVTVASKSNTNNNTGKKKATDFTMVDSKGNTVKLSDYFGKPIVLNFWASWCSPCKSEMPEFNSVYKELGSSVQFMMVDLVSSRETKDAGAKYVSSQ